MVLAFLIGIFANALKIRRCGKRRWKPRSATRLAWMGSTPVAVVLSFLLVFRVNLAHEKWDEAREATEECRELEKLNGVLLVCVRFFPFF